MISRKVALMGIGSGHRSMASHGWFGTIAAVIIGGWRPVRAFTLNVFKRINFKLER